MATSTKQLIGRGSFGDVYKITKTDETGNVTVQCCKIVETTNFDQDLKATFERFALKKLKHINIIDYYGYYGKKAKQMLIYMEFSELGDMDHFVIRKLRQQPLSETQIISIIAQLLIAVDYTHSKYIVHRDIKPQNILCFRVEGKIIFKLSDFGCVKLLHKQYQKLRTQCGSFPYMAPQVIENRLYTQLADIYSVGVILYQLLHQGKLPYSDCQNVLAMVAQMNSVEVSYRNEFSQELNEICAKMLSFKEKDRPSAESILQKKIFKKELEKLKVYYSGIGLFNEIEYINSYLENSQSH